MIAMSAAEFDAAVQQALDSMPAELMARLDNVAFFVEEEPEDSDDPDILGLYVGTALTERDDGWGMGNLPDRIIVYRGPLQRMCSSRAELIEEIQVTVVHEIAHHFGIDDERLHELGWG